MKSNDFMIIYVLVSGILIGAVMYSTISCPKYKPDASGKPPIKSVYDSHFHSFEWRGHKYLRYSDYGTHTYTLLHDPDCTCWTNRLEAIK